MFIFPMSGPVPYDIYWGERMTLHNLWDAIARQMSSTQVPMWRIT